MHTYSVTFRNGLDSEERAQISASSQPTEQKYRTLWDDREVGSASFLNPSADGQSFDRAAGSTFLKWLQICYNFDHVYILKQSLWLVR